MRVFRWVRCCGKQQFSGVGKTAACKKCGKVIDVRGEAYCVQYQYKGSQSIKSVGSKKDAEAFVASIKLARYNDADMPCQESAITWEDATKLLQRHNLLHCRKTTQDFYNFCLIPLSAAFGKYAMQTLPREAVERYQVERQQYVSATTVNREIATLKRMYSLLLDGKNVGTKLRNNALDVMRVKMLTVNNIRTRFLTVAECHNLVAAAEGYTKLVIQLALGTGLRYSNIMSLRYDQIRDGKLHFSGDEMKGHKDFVMPLSKALQDALQSHRIASGIVSPYVFTEDGRRAIKYIKGSFATAIKKAGLKDVKFHDLRRTFASLAIQNGVSIEMVSDLLAHSDISITKKRYAHVSQEGRQSAVEHMQSLMAK